MQAAVVQHRVERGEKRIRRRSENDAARYRRSPAFPSPVLPVLWQRRADEGGTVSDGGQKAQLRLPARRQTGEGADLQRGSLRSATIRLAWALTGGRAGFFFSILTSFPSPSPSPSSHLCSTDENCRDHHHNCVMVVQARLCVYSYYKNACCASCTQSAQRAKRH